MNATATPGVASDLSDRAARKTFQALFVALIVHYWAIKFMRGDNRFLVAPEVSYYFFVVPTALFGVLGLLFVLMNYVRIDRTAGVFAMFGSVAVAVALARGDYETVTGVGMFALGLFVIFSARPQVPLNLINGLFLASIPITTTLFFFGYSIYTFLPGLNEHPFHWWRVSVYPSSAAGSLFATVVFIANLAVRTQRFRLPLILLAGYFVLLGGNRTALFASLVCAAYALLVNGGAIKSVTGRRLYFVVGFAVFLLSVFASQILLQLPFADNQFVRDVILREEVVNPRFEEGGQVATAAIRMWIMSQHLSIFWENPLFGVGTYDFVQFTTGYGALDDLTTGSETFATALLARVGIVAVLLFVGLFLIRQPLSGYRLDLCLCSKVALAIGMTTYGSFVNVYNIVFMLLVLGISGCIAAPPPPVRTSGRPEGALAAKEGLGR